MKGILTVIEKWIKNMDLFRCNYSSIQAAKMIGTGIAIAIEIIVITCTIYTGIFSLHVGTIRWSIYMGCLLTTGIVLGLMTYLIFIQKRFKNWFSDIGFFLYVVCVLLMFVCTLTTGEKKDLFLLIVNGLMLFLLAAYTRCLSWYYTLYVEYMNEEHDKYTQFLSSSTERGDCITIPLKGTLKPGTSKI